MGESEKSKAKKVTGGSEETKNTRYQVASRTPLDAKIRLWRQVLEGFVCGKGLGDTRSCASSVILEWLRLLLRGTEMKWRPDRIFRNPLFTVSLSLEPPQ